ncbi:patatin-like phospholipase family protein [Brevundimonas sp. 2R-24]|uniref:Patatin-like phospholipase family protein n=1 Tax=Peiella sedimenti TaxID=3061083 RepID=A0ABT8SPK7_9CAUL|nr:patatin-like phospholipase family protein [Caulobacteraceae bacterium XZ-24]
MKKRGQDNNLEAALSRLFAVAGDRAAPGGQASWFSLTGGERLFSAGDAAETLFLLKAGRLGVFRREEGRPSQFLGVVRPGEPVGEMSLLAGTPHSSTVVALRDSELLALPRDAFFEAARREPEVMTEMARLMIRRARDQGSGVAEPSVFGFIGLREPLVRPIVDRIAAEMEALGFTARVIGSDAMPSVAEWFSSIEDDYDVILYVAETEESAWAHFIRRQVDRLFLMADMADRPTASKAAARPLPGDERLTDLILIRRGPQPPKGTPAWLDAIQPARWLHMIEGEAADEARLARLLTGTAVGLVLSGGGARAYAHVGAAKALSEAGVDCDVFAGVSMGAIVSAGLALGWTQAELETRIREAFVEASPLSDIALPILAMTQGRKVEQLLKTHFGDIEISDMPLPWLCVSTDLTNGGFVVHRRGKLREALRATISLPGVMPPVIQGGAVLVDGAVVKNFPADVLRAEHAGPIVGVDVTRARGVQPEAVDGLTSAWRWVRSGRWRQGPPIVSILMRSATLSSEGDVKAARQAVDVLVSPNLDGVEIRDWKAFEPAVAAGRAATEAALALLDGPLTHLRVRKRLVAQPPEAPLEPPPEPWPLRARPSRWGRKKRGD